MTLTERFWRATAWYHAFHQRHSGWFYWAIFAAESISAGPLLGPFLADFHTHMKHTRLSNYPSNA